MKYVQSDDVYNNTISLPSIEYTMSLGIAAVQQTVSIVTQ